MEGDSDILLSCVHCKKRLLEPFKRIKCLHPLCMECVSSLNREATNRSSLNRDAPNRSSRIECPECKVVTLSRGGRPLASILPTCFSSTSVVSAASGQAAEAGAAGGVRAGFAECNVESCTERAVKICDERECSEVPLALCNKHTRKHQGKGHTLKDIVDDEAKSGTGGRGANNCCTHFMCPLSKFCKQCCEAVCNECLVDGPHDDHRLSQVIELHDAAEQSRADVAAYSGKVGPDSGGSRNKINDKLEELKRMRTAIQEQAAQVSSRITVEFERKIELLKKQKDKLLGDVDRLEKLKIHTIDEQRCRVESCVRELDDLVDISKTCAGDYDTVLVAPWVKARAVDVALEAEKDVGPHEKECRTVCDGLANITRSDIEEVGLVFDRCLCDIDLEQSTVHCPENSKVDSPTTVTVQLKARDGEVIPKESSLYMAVTLSVSRANDEAANLPISRCTANRSQWTCQLQPRGRFQVSAAFKEKAFTHSPWEMVSGHSRLEFFHPELCAFNEKGKLWLSEDSGTVRAVEGQVLRSAYTEAVSSGVHNVRVDFKTRSEQGGCFPLCGLVSADNTPLFGDYSANDTFSGCGANGNIEQYRGGATITSGVDAVRRWQKAVTFVLCVNCDKRTFTMKCQQPGERFKVVWNNIPEKVRLRAGFFYEDTSFTLSPG